MSSWNNQTTRGSWHGRGKLTARGVPASKLSRRQMELVPSVSRSSGLDADGDTLKDFRVQEEYRTFLQEKIEAVLLQQPCAAKESDKEARQRVDAQENMLILFRKLREGIFSSKRQDAFALEVYETSLYLAAAFDSPRQTISVIQHLIPTLYLASPLPHENRTLSILISLLYQLVADYPSQKSYRKHIDTIPPEIFSKEFAGFRWITSVAKSLRVQNYALLGSLLRRTTVLAAISDTSDDLAEALRPLVISQPQEIRHILPRRAFLGLVDSLAWKFRSTTWEIIRSAYREMSCNGSERTDEWLQRSLCLQPLTPRGAKMGGEEWLEAQRALGHTRRKEGIAGKWTIYKAR